MTVRPKRSLAVETAMYFSFVCILARPPPLRNERSRDPERGVSAAYFLSVRDFPLDMLIRFSILWLHYESPKRT